MFDIFRSLYFRLIIAFVIVLAIGVGLASLLISRFTINEFGFYLHSPALIPESAVLDRQFLRGNQDILTEKTPAPGIMRRGPIGKASDERIFLPGGFTLTPDERQGLRDSMMAGLDETRRFIESLNLSIEEKQTLQAYLNNRSYQQGRIVLNIEERQRLRDSLRGGPDETKRVVESFNLNPEDKQVLLEYLNRGMIRTIFPVPTMRNISQRLGDSEQDFLDEVGKYLWLSAGIAFFVAIMISLFFTRQILYPLRRLSMASHSIASGDFKSRVEIKSRDEIGKLGIAFNQMAQTLQTEKEREKALMADVSHELRTPLSILGGKLEAMLDDVIKPTPEELASMHDEVLLLSRLVQDLQTLSVAEAGRLEMHFAQTDIVVLASKIVSSFKNMADSKNISLILQVDKDISNLFVDPDRISQVLRNLLSNALRYTPADGKIDVKIALEPVQEKIVGDTVSNKASDGMAVFSVSDNGPGISQDEITHLFERFHRSDHSRSRAAGGSGLGLAIAKQLVEAHKGKIWVDSKAGKGSTFYFSIPIRVNI